MGLTEYKKKRNFSNTPEPGGIDKEKKQGLLKFVVQKHRASHLHYDFRIELDNVLKSWAIPKGPSLNPRDKRLSMMVEDHPIEYGDFEGVIPKGNYGAGEVIIWDEGDYMVPALVHASKEENEIELRKMFSQGNIKLLLNGRKLKGEFALVKTHRKDGKENEWLLIKKSDSYAKESDILIEDKSVRSSRTIEDLQKLPSAEAETWHPPRNAGIDLSSYPKGDFPEFVKPMLATLSGQPFDKDDWIFEIKWDGFRCLSIVNYNKVELWSRNQLQFTRDFPEVAEALRSLGHKVVFDGEIVVLDERGISSFQLIQNFKRTGKGQLAYYIFDILHLDGHDLTGIPLNERKKLLKSLIEGLGPLIRFSDHIEKLGCSFYEEAARQQLEGIIAKRAGSRYIPGKRVNDWLKIKILQQQEAVIIGFTEPRGSRKKLGSLILGAYENGTLTYIGNSGGGFDQKTLDEIYTLLIALEVEMVPVANPPKSGMPVHWTEPKLVCEVKFQEWTDDGVMRQPVFLGLRPDKLATEVVRERSDGEFYKKKTSVANMRPAVPKNSSSSKVKEKTKKQVEKEQDLLLPEGKQGMVAFGKARLKITNLNKVLWPDQGISKRDLINYYHKISEFILPYLYNRPQSLRRSPHGLAGGDFFQKNMPDSVPEWVQTEKIYSESDSDGINYLICNNSETLLYMANLGCIEINPWNSKLDSLNYPDYTVIDLDPKVSDFNLVMEVALTVKEVLHELGINAYPKTSGSRGLHIFIPLGAKYNYDQVKDFTHLLVTIINRRLPELTTLERLPANRKAPVYLDYLQNRKGQTLASVYCLRPRPGAPVSTPLYWEELKKGFSPDQFNIRTIFDRLAEVGDIFKPVLTEETSMEEVLNRLVGIV